MPGIWLSNNDIDAINQAAAQNVTALLASVLSMAGIVYFTTVTTAAGAAPAISTSPPKVSPKAARSAPRPPTS